MADISDVEIALVTVIGSINYAACPIIGSSYSGPVKVFRGMPSNSMLRDDRSSGIVDVAVFPIAGNTRNTTRWGVQTYVIPGEPGLNVTVQLNTAVFAGTANAGDLAGVLTDGNAYVYAARAGDSAQLVAAALADAIRQRSICWLNGATLTLPGVDIVVARTTAFATSINEWGRQEQDLRISAWAPNPTVRDQIGSAITAELASAAFLQLADSTSARLRYHSGLCIDEDQGVSFYRRDLIYSAEYAVTTRILEREVLFGDLVYNESSIIC